METTVKKIINAQQILDIILPIPEEQFIIDWYGNSKGQSCFLGHIHRKLSPNGPDDYRGDEHGYGARELTKKFMVEKHELCIDGAEINNSPDWNGYNEPTPKARVVHMLQDMIQAGY